MKQQRGFLTIAAVVMIVIFGITSAMLVSMFIRISSSTTYLAETKKSIALAESGLQQGVKTLTMSTITSRQSCVGLSNTTGLGTGSFSVIRATDTANSINPRYAFSTLSGAITAGATPTTLAVSNSSVFASQGGRVLIGREVFQYQRIANATTLAGVTRAQDGTLASAHDSGTQLSQYQCTMASTGTSPTSSPLGVREYHQAIQQPVIFTAGAAGTILRWNSDANELTWGSMSPGTFVFNGISVLNYHAAWAVANSNGTTSYRFSRLQGNAWINTNLALTQSRNLSGVYATSDKEAWAVGALGQGNTFTLMLWTRDAGNSDTNWCKVSCGGKTVSTTGTTAAARVLFAVKAIDTNGDGFADIGYTAGGQAGTGANNRGLILSYNGSAWANFALPATTNRIGQLSGLDMLSANEAYFVGGSSLNATDGKLFRWRSGAWSAVTTTTTIMNSVSVVDTNGDGLADFGMAVGDTGKVYTFNGSFAVTGPTTIAGAANLQGVVVLSATDAWAVDSAGNRFHYDGSSWVTLNTGVATGSSLNGVSAVSPKNSPISSWYDLIN